MINQHYVSCLTIMLSRDLVGVDVDDIGYHVSMDNRHKRRDQIKKGCKARMNGMQLFSHSLSICLAAPY